MKLSQRRKLHAKKKSNRKKKGWTLIAFWWCQGNFSWFIFKLIFRKREKLTSALAKRLSFPLFFFSDQIDSNLNPTDLEPRSEVLQQIETGLDEEPGKCKIMTQLMKTENLRTIIITSTCHTLIHVILGELVKYMQNVDMGCQQNPERMINSRWNQWARLKSSIRKRGIFVEGNTLCLEPIISAD